MDTVQNDAYVVDFGITDGENSGDTFPIRLRVIRRIEPGKGTVQLLAYGNTRQEAIHSALAALNDAASLVLVSRTETQMHESGGVSLGLTRVQKEGHPHVTFLSEAALRNDGDLAGLLKVVESNHDG